MVCSGSEVNYSAYFLKSRNCGVALVRAMTNTTITLLDLTHEAKNPPAQKVKPSSGVGPERDGTKLNIAKLDAHGKVFIRDPKLITGIGIHQTDCIFGPKADPAARHLRALGVPIHALAFRDGVLAIPYPMLWYMYHGNGMNAMSYGLEIEGSYSGILGQKRAGGKTYDLLDERTIECARAGIKYLYEAGLKLNSPLEFLWAHRQTNKAKDRDPGPAIWQAVVLDYAVAVLHLKLEENRVWDDGHAIPASWSVRKL